MYRWVYKANASLSREMEFDADKISYSIVGTKTFVSAMCKVDATSGNYEAYLRIANSLIGNGYVFDNLFAHYENVLEKLPSNCRTIIRTNEVLTEPIKHNKIPYGMVVESLYDSHPSLTQRIVAAKKANIDVSCSSLMQPAFSLIPPILVQKLSDEVQPKTDGENRILHVIDKENFNQWIENEIDQNYYDDKHIALFSASWFPFDVDDESITPIIESPVNNNLMEFLHEYIAAESDLRTFNNIDGDTFDNNVVSYNGIRLGYKNFGDEQKKLENIYFDYQNRMVEELKKIFSFMLNHCDSDKEKVKIQWKRLFHCIYINHQVLFKLEESRNAIHYTLSHMGNPSEEEVGQIQLDFQSYLQSLQAAIKEVDLNGVSLIVNEKFVNLLTWIVNEADKHYELSNGDYLKQMVIDVPDTLREIYKRLQYGEELQLYRMLKVID